MLRLTLSEQSGKLPSYSCCVYIGAWTADAASTQCAQTRLVFWHWDHLCLGITHSVENALWKLLHFRTLNICESSNFVATNRPRVLVSYKIIFVKLGIHSTFFTVFLCFMSSRSKALFEVLFVFGTYQCSRLVNRSSLFVLWCGVWTQFPSNIISNGSFWSRKGAKNRLSRRQCKPLGNHDNLRVISPRLSDSVRHQSEYEGDLRSDRPVLMLNSWRPACQNGDHPRIKLLNFSNLLETTRLSSRQSAAGSVHRQDSTCPNPPMPQSAMCPRYR